LLKSEYNIPIHEKINSSINEIATNRKGCQFLKKYLETVDESKVKTIVNNIYKNLDCIIMDQYGNYLIQNLILENNPAINKENILNDIFKNIVKYSNQKFASNVVEKCFELNNEFSEKIINEILKKENFNKMLLDNYGNYVVQKAINKTEGEIQDKFLKMIVENVHDLEKVNFGQKLLSKLLIQYPKLKLFMLNLSA
jgi:pumilio RNA-binding family